MRSILSEVSRRHGRRAAGALKAIFASETRQAALAKAESVAAEMGQRKLDQAAACLREGVGGAAACLLGDCPRGHRRRIRTNSMIERLDREIRRRTRVVGAFPDGESALMPITAGIRCVTADDWSARRRLDMPRLRDTMQEANWTPRHRRAGTKVRKNPGTTRPFAGEKYEPKINETHSLEWRRFRSQPEQ